MPRSLPFCLLLAAVLMTGAGCSNHFDPHPRPVVVGHMNIAQKQELIQSTKTTLKTYQQSARDLRSRNKPIALQELNDGFRRYVRLHVDPIVADFEAENNLETRLEIAKLQLLCALVLTEMGDAGAATRLLKEMDRRYGDNPSFLGTAMDRRDIGYASLDEGLQALRSRLRSETAAPQPMPSPMTVPRT